MRSAAGRLRDEDAYGDGVEDGPQKGFAFAESLLGFFAVVDIFDGAVPADDFAGGIAAWRCAGAHPAPDPVAAANAKFDIDGNASSHGIFPSGGLA